MKDPKEQELIEALDETDRKWDEVDREWDEASCKWAEADRKLWKYRVIKAQQGRRAIGRTVDGIVGSLEVDHAND